MFKRWRQQIPKILTEQNWGIAFAWKLFGRTPFCTNALVSVEEESHGCWALSTERWTLVLAQAFEYCRAYICRLHRAWSACKFLLLISWSRMSSASLKDLVDQWLLLDPVASSLEPKNPLDSLLPEFRDSKWNPVPLGSQRTRWTWETDEVLTFSNFMIPNRVKKKKGHVSNLAPLVGTQLPMFHPKMSFIRCLAKVFEAGWKRVGLEWMVRTRFLLCRERRRWLPSRSHYYPGISGAI